MKLNIIVAAVTVLLFDFCDNVHSDYTDMEAIFESCRVQVKATDADVKLWRSELDPKPKIVKCLDACVFEKMGLVANGHINVDAAMKMFAKDNKDDKKLAEMKEVLNECKGETDKDPCEASAKILKCLSIGSRKRGIKEMV